MNRKIRKHFILLAALIVSVASFAYIMSPLFKSVTYVALSPLVSTNLSDTYSSTEIETSDIVEQVEKKSTHVQKPEAVKAIYMTSWVAGTRDWRKQIIKLIEDTELNAVVIDIKDATGRISFNTDSEYLINVGASENRIPDIREFIEWIHERDIYVIGRISVFQDPFLAQSRPDLAVRRESDGGIWEDYKGISWLDPSAREVWEYTVEIARASYEIGFDELNFDYIRFPSDGDMHDISYPFSNDKINADPNFGKANIMREFYAYVYEEMKDTGAVTSADLFGMTTINRNDLNIGQILEYAAPYFDYIAPMVYPSHYPDNFIGYPDPNHFPYEIIKYSMDKAVLRLEELGSNMRATSTVSGHGNVGLHQLRPWLQDFDYGGVYGEKEIRAQKQAVYDAGLTSWMLWDPAVRYTRSALDNE